MYERYCELRDGRGLRDAAVANATGIPKSTFSDWKSGRSVPKIEKLQRIADFFGVTVDYLMGVENEARSPEPLPALTAEEAELLRIFRGLNDVGRARALESLEDMLQIPKYTDKSKESSISNAG